jgi:isoaspartyl peptidase/L-asparaginase-like protein (Ntn-hydrolase superfamily)
MSPLAFIIVHGGAGVHDHKDEEKVKRALKM